MAALRGSGYLDASRLATILTPRGFPGKAGRSEGQISPERSFPPVGFIAKLHDEAESRSRSRRDADASTR
jgi:hypothetical protein